MESMDASLAPSFLQLPAGFRFHPTDEELIVHYLKRKTSSYPLPISIIAEIDLYKFDPWELPSKAVFGEHEWYFFSPRDRKYPNGARPNRAATSGYWKATGIDKPILTSSGGQQVGVKKALVFYGGKPPRGIKTEWIMQEYRLIDTSSNPSQPNLDNSRKGSLRLDDWVLCRIYKKNHGQRSAEQDRNHRLVEEMIKRQQQQEKIIASPLTSRITTTSCDGTLADYTHQSNGDLFRGVADQIQQSSVTQRSWDEMGYVGSPSSKRFKSDRTADSTGIHENNSFISLMNQIPSQSGTFPLYSFSEGLLGDGVLRLTTPFQSSGAT